MQKKFENRSTAPSCRYCHLRFLSADALKVHEQFEAHCSICGETFGEPLTNENKDRVCSACKAELAASQMPDLDRGTA